MAARREEGDAKSGEDDVDDAAAGGGGTVVAAAWALGDGVGRRCAGGGGVAFGGGAAVPCSHWRLAASLAASAGSIADEGMFLGCTQLDDTRKPKDTRKHTTRRHMIHEG